MTEILDGMIMRLYQEEYFSKPWVNIAITLLGAPCGYFPDYHTGNTPEGFNCSGLCVYSLTHAGYSLPVLSNGKVICKSYEIWDFFGNRVSKIEEGDFVFFSKFPGERPSHMAICLGIEDLCIEARGAHNYTNGNPVTVTTTRISLILRRKKFSNNPPASRYPLNPIGYKRP